MDADEHVRQFLSKFIAVLHHLEKEDCAIPQSIEVCKHIIFVMIVFCRILLNMYYLYCNYHIKYLTNLVLYV